MPSDYHQYALGTAKGVVEEAFRVFLVRPLRICPPLGQGS